MYRFFREAFFFVYNPLKVAYWFVFRPITKGAFALIIADGHILLVKQSYGHKKWSMPGGGVDKRESFEDAAVRETLEEAGVTGVNPRVEYTFENRAEYKRDTVAIVSVDVSFDTTLTHDGFEIVGAKWFPLHSLPVDTFSRTIKTLDQLNISYSLQK